MKIQRLVVGVTVLLGCAQSDGYSPVGPPGGIIEVDPSTIPIGGAAAGAGGAAAGMGGRGGSTGGSGGASGCPSVAGTASLSADGVLTNYPAFRFTKLRGDIQITTAYFKLENLTSFSSVQLWGDLKNNGTRQLCIPLSEIFNIGAQSVLVVVDGKPYKSSASRVTDDCLDPGGTAAYRGIENDVSPSLLTTATGVSYEFSGLAFSTPAAPEPYDPVLLSAAPKQVSLGWALAGQMRSSSMTIWNMGMMVYIRDANGLLYDDTSAFPFTLGDIPPFTTFDFETYSTPSRFCAFERYDSFIEGSESQLAFSDPDDPGEARRSVDQGRRAALRAARSLMRR